MTQVKPETQMMPKILKPVELIRICYQGQSEPQADKFNIQIEVEYPEERRSWELFVEW